MSFDYTKTKETVNRLIKSFGQKLIVTRQINNEYNPFLGEGYNPATGEVTSTTESFNRDVVWTEYRNQEIDGTTIQRGDARLLVSGEVLIGDKVTKNGTVWRILDVSPLQPANLTVIYIAQARQ